MTWLTMDDDGTFMAHNTRAHPVLEPHVFGGRWSLEASNFVKLLAKARARSEPWVVQKRMEQAWRLGGGVPSLLAPPLGLLRLLSSD